MAGFIACLTLPIADHVLFSPMHIYRIYMFIMFVRPHLWDAYYATVATNAIGFSAGLHYALGYAIVLYTIDYRVEDSIIYVYTRPVAI